MIEFRTVSGNYLDPETKVLLYPSIMGEHAFLAGDVARAVFLRSLGYSEAVSVEHYVLCLRNDARATIQTVLKQLMSLGYDWDYSKSTRPHTLHLHRYSSHPTLDVSWGVSYKPSKIADILQRLPLDKRFAVSSRKQQFTVWWDEEAGKETEKEIREKLLEGKGLKE